MYCPVDLAAFSYKQRHILTDRRPCTAACPVPSFLDDGEKEIEIEYGEGITILYWAD
jgi:hypothetical protein